MDAVRIMMATFPTTEGATGAVDQLEAMAKAGSIKIVDAAVVSRSLDGSTDVDQVTLPGMASWAGRGALIGGIVGLVFPPAVIGSALVGAGIGATSAAIARHALKNEDLEEAARDLAPGTSAFIAVVEETWVRQMATALEGYERLAEHTLDADTSANLQLIADEAAGIAAASADVVGTDEDGNPVVASMDRITDTDTGISYTTGEAVSTDGEVVVSATTEQLEVPDEVPDAMGGYEALQAEAEDEDDEAGG
jgi:uncharacterized membrane protein